MRWCRARFDGAAPPSPPRPQSATLRAARAPDSDARTLGCMPLLLENESRPNAADAPGFAAYGEAASPPRRDVRASRETR